MKLKQYLNVQLRLIIICKKPKMSLNKEQIENAGRLLFLSYLILIKESYIF